MGARTSPRPPLLHLDREAFTRIGRKALGAHWEEDQEAYEARWLGPDSPQRDRGEIRLLGWSEGGEARVGLWLPAEGTPTFFLYAREGGMSAEAARAFLGAVLAWCRERGIAELIGPLPFSTWHPYRFISALGDAPFFPGEQRMPEAYHADFAAAGFADLAEYQSTWVPDAEASLDRGRTLGIQRLLSGLDVVRVPGPDMAALLPEIHRVSLDIFRDNFAYTPIALSDFLALSAGGKGEKGGKAVLIVARTGSGGDGRTAGIGYGYSIGPYAREAGQAAQETVVLKTLGVLPEFRGRGLGYGLAYAFHEYWVERGHTGLIHAYMKSDNRSRGMSDRFARPIRTYSLMRGTP